MIKFGNSKFLKHTSMFYNTRFSRIDVSLHQKSYIKFNNNKQLSTSTSPSSTATMRNNNRFPLPFIVSLILKFYKIQKYADVNPSGVKMLPEWLYESIFKRKKRPELNQKHIIISLDHLKKNDLLEKKLEEFPSLPPQFNLPKLTRNTIAEHFWYLGYQQANPHIKLAKEFANLGKLPEMPSPSDWKFEPGWVRYVKNKVPEPVDYPREQILCFDVETMSSYGDYGMIACAASPTAWYAWTSPSQDRIIIGHNVGFDRARILEEYSCNGSKNKFLDTICLHMVVNGLSSTQRSTWIKYQKAMLEKNENFLNDAKRFKPIYDISSINNLQDVYRLHCHEDIDKSLQEVFVNGTIEDVLIPGMFQKIMTYCANDVLAIHRIYCKLLPQFFDVCPHPVSFAGMLHMGSMFLPTSNDWNEHVNKIENIFQSQRMSMERDLEDLALATLEEGMKNPDKVEQDEFLKQLDWSPSSNNARFLPGYPKWCREIYDPKEGRLKLSHRMKVTPILLRLKWKEFPLYYSMQYGWTYRVPKNSNYKTNEKPCVFEVESIDNDLSSSFQLQRDFTSANLNDATEFKKEYMLLLASDKSGIYYCVPNKLNDESRCMTPFSKKYFSDYEKKIITSEFDSITKNVFDTSVSCSYWISVRERALGQMVIGMILPQTIAMGTITRRSVESTWMTVSNIEENRVGSELKALIQAPKGYKIIGADVDSEELWISSLIGDSQFGFHGSTAMSWMTIQGNKSESTDMHSQTAKILKISRSDAKTFNYGRIYGAGLKFAAQLLRQCNLNITEKEASERAEELFNFTKGKRFASKNIKDNKNKPQKIPYDDFWYGGSESYMFNSLEDIAFSFTPRTPVLKCGMTEALKKGASKSEYMRSKINWVVQSSGVDYLHLLLVSMQYLIEKYDIKARFMISIYDEIRFLVEEHDSYRAALALQISNLWTRAMFSYMMGIEDLPLSTAFFSTVDIDHVLRKGAGTSCKTVSYDCNIENGESLTIHELLKHQISLQKNNNYLEEDVINFDTFNVNNSRFRKSKKKDNLLISQPTLQSTSPPPFLLKQHNSYKDDLFLEIQSLGNIKRKIIIITLQQWQMDRLGIKRNFSQ
nr:12899_t:CDS:2 [Entrophospora candida]